MNLILGRYLHCADVTLPTTVIATVEKEGEATIEFRGKRKDGTLFDVLMAIKKIIDHDDNVFYLASCLDISQIKENERQLRQSATVFENTTEGVMITDANATIIDINDAFSDITGLQRSEVIGKNPSILQSGRHHNDFYELMWKSIEDKGSWQGEIWNRRKNGEIFPEWLNISSVKNELGNIEGFISVFSDITSLKETAEKLDFLAYHDHLTELPNRTLLKARLEHTISTAKRNKTLTAVMYMDIDNFKNINDSYGHSLGDKILVAVAKRINNIMREDDTLARLGGDEFIIAMNHFKSPEHVVHFVQIIMNLFEESFIVEEKEFWITLSMGISIAPDDGITPEILIKNADTAMYEAKGDGKSTFKFYNKKMSAISFERVVVENALKSGINNHEFEVYYQPQEDLSNNEIIGFEALVRWHHPTLGVVSPNRFIPIAEDTKMILAIGEFVLKQACKDIKKWHDEGLCDGRIAVNVSGVQLEHSEFAEILKYCLTHYEVDPSMIEIEVTESMVMKNPERWISILEEIKRIGVAISIDDFGTGYSSLSCLRRLPADTLKIDRSFIQDIPNENDACSIVNAIINMADSLGLDTLAEGIETMEQREYLVEKGCKYAQGFLFSRPMNGRDTYSWLKERQ
ncbi:MAG: diguanylate cyclase/phosphodiesterase (GGDEF & EAL domains) with PAS/PAC sensor(s) [uncultured Sulfurovum sp.]|uniref:Diguanylate cyclase/phosphodiesterase (GGDEF & EAL domains) with PAS/PAC sensor(S) n=1 Tax=uncultured Sulfurovum sp. TaxID=269237 RepID=A0A6S6RVK5_9BACT|nr:MAG: diguanylate cyclase/phosphodiesterase (GGDEF & EAL domains) with PAS/PAC sensor(s) [uncultured Sulfurovum sp.]